MSLKRRNSWEDFEVKKPKIEKNDSFTVLLMGIPGSGKSYLRDEITSLVKSKFNIDSDFNFGYCNPDEEVKSLKRYSEKEHSKYLKFGSIKALERFKSYVKDGKSLIYDGTGMNNSYKFFIRHSKENNFKVILIKIDTDIKIALERIKMRKRKVDAYVVERIHENLESKYNIYKELVDYTINLKNN
tara:strand:- start:406 stop:963 length:558 start_codon:yes stop_codon:yes gene_type:complete